MIFKALFLFCGIGGGALGFQNAREEYRGLVGRFETLCGIDVDKEACADFEALTGAPAVQMDLFSREQYADFHGCEPPEDWQEATPYDIWRATGGVYPDVVFTSPPCKGFSGLLPEKISRSRKYQALNQLTVRGIRLVLEAFEDDAPALILLENVPRITTRGAALLDEIKVMLKKHGYAVSEGYHDCGEIGGLAQHRKRYLLIARNERKVMPFVYRPPRKRVRTIGEVLGSLPLPDDPAGGAMHRLPRLQWKTWVRLALIPAGGDWRDLEKIEWEKYRITHVPRKGAMAVGDWNEPSGTVTGAAGFGRSNGIQAVADPRINCNSRPNLFGVTDWYEPISTVTGSAGVTSSNGVAAVSDPRLPKRKDRHPAVYQVVKWEEHGPCVTGTRFGSGAPAIADPRIECSPRSGTYGVQKWNEPAKTVIGAGDIHAGAVAVADPRIPDDHEKGVWVILAEDGTWHRPLTTYELAVLQGFPTHMPDGRPLELAGKNDARWRERIGNAVPPAAAQAIAETMLRTLMANRMNEWLMAAEDIWVAPSESNRWRLIDVDQNGYWSWYERELDPAMVELGRMLQG